MAQLFHDAIRALSAADYSSEQVVAWASALLHQIHESAAGLGLTRLYTEASITARPVFEKHGFRVLEPQDVRLSNTLLRNYRMEKTLQPDG